MVDCYGASFPMLARGICVSSSALVSQPFIRSTKLWPMFLKCFMDVNVKMFFFFNKHTSNLTLGERAGLEVWWWLWGRGVTCHLIQLYFNLQRLEESHSANDCGREARVQEGGSRDFSRWYLLRNHLDMNYSSANGNPYSSSFPKAFLRGCRWEAAFMSPSYPLPHPCSLIKTLAY